MKLIFDILGDPATAAYEKSINFKKYYFPFSIITIFYGCIKL